MQRVVITGMGAVTPLGHTATDTWAAMRAGRVAIGPITSMPRDGLRFGIAAEVQGFDPLAHFDEKKLILFDRVSQFALVAAREAVAQSRIDFAADGLGENTAVVIGTGIGGEQTHDEASRRLYGENNPRTHPLTIVRLMANAPACQISIEHKLTGPAFATSSACASANHALAQAFHMVRSGVADAAVAGGTEACITLGVIKAWEAMRVMADDTCRPFSKQRRGMVLGEGAGVFVLETLERAQRRGATILAEFAGAGMSADAGDIVEVASDGPIAGPVELYRKSLTLRAAAGFTPAFEANSSTNVIDAFGADTLVAIVIEGLTVRGGTINSYQAGTGPFGLTIRGNIVEADGLDANRTGIRLGTFGSTPTGPVNFAIVDNDVNLGFLQGDDISAIGATSS